MAHGRSRSQPASNPLSPTKAKPWTPAIEQVIPCGSPIRGEKFVETAVRPEIDETEDNVDKVAVRIDPAELAALDQRSHDGPASGAVVVTGEERWSAFRAQARSSRV